jgi:hypothetical protein
MVWRALVALAFFTAGPAAAHQDPLDDPTTMLLLRLEQAAAAGDPQAILELVADPHDEGVRTFASTVNRPLTGLIIKERDRTVLETGHERLLIEMFVEFGRESAITAWRVDVAGGTDPAAARLIEGMEQLTSVTGLHRLELNPTRQFDVRRLRFTAIDLTLDLPAGRAFVAETSDGPTAVVLLGRGQMRFTPSDAAERTQVRIFGGNEVLTADFEAVFIRLRPADFTRLFSSDSLVPRPVSPGDLRRATSIFDEYIGHSLQLDLTDLSRERWSLVPGFGDLIIEIRTRRHGSLTYARSSRDAEDIAFFDRRRRRNIALYASPQKLATRGRFYNEDDLADYDMLHYDIDAAFVPERVWVDGSATLRLRTRVQGLTSLTLRLAEPLVVRSVVSPQFGRLLHLRVVGQNSIIVNLPTTLVQGTDVQLQITYGGRLAPQQIEGDATAVSGQDALREPIYIPIERYFLYSNRSYWYPQSLVTDYATARLRLSVPTEFDVVATGIPTGAPESLPPESLTPGQRSARLFVFETEQPARYLACLISRFTEVSTSQIFIDSPARDLTGARSDADDDDGAHSAEAGDSNGGDLLLQVVANPRQVARARSLAERAASIIEYYGQLMGDAPYPTFTLAVTESELPGGHSPAYFAMLNQPLPLLQRTWRNDPVAFDGYPPFFLAHEIAHQWWGQAVGWKNYREQWLSEGFAQYFAVLYAGYDRGEDLQTSIMRQMRRWSMDQSAQGPVHLGYRLGHIRGDSRVFRALVYNKGAMVLHMLRRLIGDDRFFDGLRRFYTEWMFKKAGTDDLRQIMEAASGQDLTSFFEAWIYGSGIPTVGFGSALTEQEAFVRFEHHGEVIPLPITVSIHYTDGRIEDVIVPVTEATVDRRLPLAGTVRSIEANRDHAALADIVRLSGGLPRADGR